MDKQELINSIFLHLSCLIKFIACQKIFHAQVNFMVIVFKITTILLELYSEYPTQGVHELSDTFWSLFFGSIQTYFTNEHRSTV